MGQCHCDGERHEYQYEYDYERQHGYDYQRRDEPDGLVYGPQLDVFALQLEIMPCYLYQFSDYVDVLVA